MFIAHKLTHSLSQCHSLPAFNEFVTQANKTKTHLQTQNRATRQLKPPRYKAQRVKERNRQRERERENE